MGAVRVDVKLTNAIDEGLHLQSQLEADKIRSYTANALVDTGAVPTVVPQFVVDELGLNVVRKRSVEYADGRNESVDVVGPITIDIRGRGTIIEAVVLGDEVLIGQTVLEMIDMQVDCMNRQLVPNPAHPDQPVVKVK